MPRLWMFAVCAAAFVVSSAADETTKADFFVATDGDDAWSGRLDAPNAAKTDGPFASVDKARQAVRELKAAAPGRAAPVVVLIRGGFYALPAALTFTPEDSGTEQAPVVYGSYGNERPVLSGGCLLYTSDAADDLLCVDLGGRRIIKKKTKKKKKQYTTSKTQTYKRTTKCTIHISHSRSNE